LPGVGAALAVGGRRGAGSGGSVRGRGRGDADSDSRGAGTGRSGDLDDDRAEEGVVDAVARSEERLVDHVGCRLALTVVLHPDGDGLVLERPGARAAVGDGGRGVDPVDGPRRREGDAGDRLDRRGLVDLEDVGGGADQVDVLGGEVAGDGPGARLAREHEGVGDREGHPDRDDREHHHRDDDLDECEAGLPVAVDDGAQAGADSLDHGCSPPGRVREIG